MTSETMRAEFETWGKTMSGWSGHRDKFGDYVCESEEFSWRAWQASRAAMQSQDREDAERYRWLKKQFRILSPDMGGNHTWVLQRPLREGCSIDAVCDAARGATENES